MLSAETLAAEEIHIWQSTLDVGEEQARRWSRLLSEDEREQAARFRFERHRLRYIAGRAQLRMLLARYLDASPAELVFSYGLNGKPSLPAPAPHFNLSHSGALALYAVTADAEVGVDVELYDPSFPNLGIPERFFAPDEVRALRALPEELQPRGFLELWTRKEAFIKARGDGLSLALDSFSVTLGRDRPSLVRTGWSHDEPQQWTVLDLSDKDGKFLAAVAAKTEEWSVVRYRTSPFQATGSDKGGSE
jgi:4'-phosphopantetheinyl transferase